MSNIANLSVGLDADVSGFSAGISDASSKMSGFGETTAKVTGNIGTSLTAVATNVGNFASAIHRGFQSIESAADTTTGKLALFATKTAATIGAASIWLADFGSKAEKSIVVLGKVAEAEKAVLSTNVLDGWYLALTVKYASFAQYIGETGGALAAAAGHSAELIGASFNGMLISVTGAMANAWVAVTGFFTNLGVIAESGAHLVRVAILGVQEALQTYGAAIGHASTAGETLVNTYRAVRLALAPTPFTVATLAIGLLVEVTVQAAISMERLIETQAALAASTNQSFTSINTLAEAEKQLGVEAGTFKLLGITDIDKAIPRLKELAEIAKQFEGMEDPIQRAALAFSLFGEDAAKILPIISRDLETATSNAYDLSRQLDQPMRESLFRLTATFDAFINFFKSGWRSVAIESSDFWHQVKMLGIDAITSLEIGFHGLFVQMGADFKAAGIQLEGILRNLPKLLPSGGAGGFEPGMGLGGPAINGVDSNVPSALTLSNEGTANIAANIATWKANLDSLKPPLDALDEKFRHLGLTAEEMAKLATEAAAALARAFSTLGLENEAIRAKELAAAFDLLFRKGLLSNHQIIATTEKLINQLNDAFANGAISEKAFNNETERLGKVMDTAIIAVDKLKEGVKKFDPSTLTESIFAPFLDLPNKIQPVLNVFDQLKQDFGMLPAIAEADASAWVDAIEEVEGAMKQLQATISLPSVGLAKEQLDHELKIQTEYHETLLKQVHIRGAEAVETAIEANRQIQESNAFTERTKQESITNTLRIILDSETSARNEKQKQLQLEIELDTARGESATKHIIQLENIRIKLDAAKMATQGWGRLYVDLVGDFNKAFQTLGKGIVDSITGAKSWHDAWHASIKSIATMFLDTLVGTAMKALSTKLLALITESDGLFGSLSKIANALGAGVSGSGEALKEGKGILKGISQGANEGSGEAGGRAAGGGSGATSAFNSVLGGALPFVSLGVDIAKGVVSGIQLAHIESDVAKIEISTRQCKEQLVGGIQPTLNTYLPELKHLVDIWGAIINGFGGLGTSLNDIADLMNLGLSGHTSADWQLSTSGGALPATEVESPELTSMSADVRSINRLFQRQEFSASSAANLLELTSRDIRQMNEAARAALFPVLHPAEYAAQQKSAQDEAWFAKLREALLGGTNEYSNTYFATPTGPLDDLGRHQMTIDDFNRWAAEVPQRGGGISPIGDPLGEAKLRGWEDAVAKATLQAQFNNTRPGAGTSDAALFSYLSKETTFDQYRKTIADLSVAEARQAALVRDSLPKQVEAAKVLTAYEQAQADLASSSKSLQGQVDALQKSFYEATSQTTQFNQARQFGPDVARQVAADLSASLSAAVNDLRAANPGTTFGLQAGGSSGPVLPLYTDAQIQSALSAYAVQLQALEAERQQQAAEAYANTGRVGQQIADLRGTADDLTALGAAITYADLQVQTGRSKLLTIDQAKALGLEVITQKEIDAKTLRYAASPVNNSAAMAAYYALLTAGGTYYQGSSNPNMVQFPLTHLPTSWTAPGPYTPWVDPYVGIGSGPTFGGNSMPWNPLGADAYNMTNLSTLSGRFASPSSNGGGSRADVTIFAVDGSGRSIARSLVSALQESNISVT